MADVTTPNIFTTQPGGIDAGVLAALISNKNNDGFGNSFAPILGIAALRMLMPGGFGNEGLHNQNADRAAIDSAVSAALAQNNQANNNAMLLLKDIQDTGQDVVGAINAASNAGIAATLNAEIANLQGQGAISTAIADAKYTTVNETHEAAADVIAAGTANTQQLAATMNMLATNLQAGHAEINAAIQQAKYDNTIATMNDGDKTRAAIAALAATIPNSRELDLQRQLAVALDDHRHTQTRGVIDSGNVSVITNVNQAQTQAQMQQQLQVQSNLLSQLAAHQVATANNMNILGSQRGINQTPVNVGN